MNNHSTKTQELQRKIFELNKTNESLRSEILLYTTILEKLPFGLQIFDENGFLSKINNAQKEILEVPDLDTGIGKFNVLTDQYSIAIGASELFKDAYKGNGGNHEFEFDLAIPEKLWETRNGKRIYKESVIPIENKNGVIANVVAILEDVTERNRFLEELKQANKELLDEKLQTENITNHFKAMIENAPHAIFIQTDQKFSFVNRQALHFFGAENEHDLIDKPVFQRFHPEYIELSKERINNLNQNKQVQTSIEFKFIKLDGSPVFGEISGTPFRYNNSDGALAFIKDITERKIAEEEIATRNQELNKFFDCAVELLCIADASGRFIRLNKEWENVLGFQLSELENRIFLELVHPDDVDSTIETINKLSNQEKILNFKNRCKCKNGQYKWIEWRSFPQGNRIYAAARDITEKIRYEEELICAREKAEEKEQNWQTTFDAISDYVMLLNTKHEIININKAGQESINLPFSEIIGQKCYQLIHGTDYPISDCPCNQTLLSKRISVNEYVQDERAFELAAWPIFDENNNVKAFTHIVKDITERKRAEQKIKIALEKAEESDRLKTAFLSNISHEIRTPMNGILGFTELLKQPNLTAEKQQKFIEIIKNSGARMLNTINNIVDLSKIESGLMKVNITESNIHEQLQFAYNFFKPEAESKRLQLIFRNRLAKEEANIKTDHEKVYGVLVNLLMNAIKFTEEGIIEYGYEIVELHDSAGHKNSPYLQFFVKDTGIGIPKESQKAIFDRFIQAEMGDTRVYEGTGLGLSIAKSYVEMIGGKIWVESTKGKGSVFYFTIPYNAVSSVKNNIILEENKKQLRKLKILIAEDDETSRELLQMRIEDISKEILCADNGIDAVELCRSNPDIDLVLMDIQMPKMLGYEATRHIRQFNNDVIIIAQTAFAFSSDHEKAIEAGCNDFIPKPINFSKLIDKIEILFENRR